MGYNNQTWKLLIERLPEIVLQSGTLLKSSASLQRLFLTIDGIYINLTDVVNKAFQTWLRLSEW